jgi:hypothetical protein
MSPDQTYSRFFTVDEANALIPRLRPKIEAMLATFKEIRSEIEAAASQAGLAPDSPDLAKHLESRAIAPGLFERVKGLIGELQDQGCLVNGPEVGLVDFPCVYNNEIVFLCWKYGEPGVGYWHRIPDGFAGRRPLLDVSGPEEETRVH